MTSGQRICLPCVLAGTLILTSRVGCDAQPAPSAPRANEPRPPEPPVQLRQDAPKTPSAQVTDEQRQDDRPGATHSGGMPTHQPVEFSQQGSDSAQRRGSPVAQPGVASSEGAPPRFFARLSAGVALPQSLPTGTAMGMSVDYVLLDTLPTSAVQTVWVIESAQGASRDVPVPLNAQGNLMTFVTEMRPEHGPFRSYLAIMLADGRKVPISPKIDMQSP